MSESPRPLHIPELLVDGFAAEDAVAGQILRVIISGRFTSDQPLFHVYATRISRALSHTSDTFLPPIDRLLVLIHDDNSADVYINNFDITAQARVTRSVRAGEPLRAPDLSEIHSITFPGILVRPTDKMIYVGRHEWRFGLYFNLSRKIGNDNWSAELANLMSELLLRDFLEITEGLLARASPDTYDAFIVTEGKTDWRHLKRAAEALGIYGIKFDETDRDRGDTLLLRVCKELSVIPQAKPVIFLFDRDNQDIVSEFDRLGGDGGYQNLGNNVFSMLLPVPDHRVGYRRLSIEMYYPDEVLRRVDSSGRRLCFDNELKKEIYPDKSIRRVVVAPIVSREYEKSVVGQDVDNIEDIAGMKVGLSKTAFAERIFYQKNPYDGLTFAEFRPIFDLINRIATEAKRP